MDVQNIIKYIYIYIYIYIVARRKNMNLKTFLAALLVIGTLTACGGGNDKADRYYTRNN